MYTQHNTPLHDIIIIGGGIAGLYTAYRILKNNPNRKVLVLEKEERLGGRIYTFHDEYMQVEAGAGRIHSSHHLFLQLLYDLGLENKLRPIQSSSMYIDSNSGKKYSEDISHRLIQKIIRYEKKNPHTSQLQNASFLDFASKVLSLKEVQYIKNSFGFSTELYQMNAKDAIVLMKTLVHSQPFLFLAGGLEQVIHQITRSIMKMGGCIKPNCQVKEVEMYTPNKTHHHARSGGGGFSIDHEKNNSIYKIHVLENGSQKYQTYYETTHCIFALPNEQIQKFHLFHSIPFFRHIYSGSLCRIYTRFRDGSWFRNMSKFTTQNDLRMVIPINAEKGTIMISYSDSVYADRWYRYYKTYGMTRLKQRLHSLVEDTLMIKIPALGVTRIFYWKEGVGYWKIGANSNEISRKIIKPFPDKHVYICGENYSEKYQQWVEGALDTSEKVVDKLIYYTDQKEK